MLPDRMSVDVLGEVQQVAELLKIHEFDEARRLLDRLAAEGHENAPVVRVRRIQLALSEGTLPAAAAMKELIEIMRTDQHTPGAKELYMEAAQIQLSEGHSSMAHSHPPPPPPKA
jgi:hypothetical protein